MHSILRMGSIVIGSFLLGVGINALHPRSVSLAKPSIEQSQCIASPPVSTDKVQLISVEQAVALRQTFSSLVIGDVRSKVSYQQGHLPHAVHLPCQGTQGKTFFEALSSNTTLLLYDEEDSSVALQSAIQAAFQHGVHQVYILLGGFRAWREQEATENGKCEHCNLEG